MPHFFRIGRGDGWLLARCVIRNRRRRLWAPCGAYGLRAAIARHLAISRGVRASADDITITAGTQQALDVLARTLLAPGEKIAIEDPGYAPPKGLFQALGLRVIAIPVDRDGLVVDALPHDVRAVYVTPSHQYPLGVAMTALRRQALPPGPITTMRPSSKMTTIASSSSRNVR